MVAGKNVRWFVSLLHVINSKKVVVTRTTIQFDMARRRRHRISTALYNLTQHCVCVVCFSNHFSPGFEAHYLSLSRIEYKNWLLLVLLLLLVLMSSSKGRSFWFDAYVFVHMHWVANCIRSCASVCVRVNFVYASVSGYRGYTRCYSWHAQENVIYV